MGRDYRYGRSSRNNIDSCSSPIQLLCTRAMEIANRRKLYCPDFGISFGKRTAEEQMGLYAQGRTLVDDEWIITDPRQVITNCDGYVKLSSHQSGNAIDFVPIDKKGRADYSVLSCLQVVTCFMEAASDLDLDIDWGGSWKSISDLPHIEIVE